MSAPTWFFEDFKAGDESVLGSVTVTEADIVAFARQWDPQPMHVDPEAAADTFLGRLTASGWHSCCLLMRMMCDGFLLDSASMGAPAIEEVRWMRPVLPGDTLTARRTVLETRVSRKRPDLGIVRWRYEVDNQHGKTVMTMVFPSFIACRAPSEAAS